MQGAEIGGFFRIRTGDVRRGADLAASILVASVVPPLLIGADAALEASDLGAGNGAIWIRSAIAFCAALLVSIHLVPLGAVLSVPILRKWGRKGPWAHAFVGGLLGAALSALAGASFLSEIAERSFLLDLIGGMIGGSLSDTARTAAWGASAALSQCWILKALEWRPAPEPVVATVRRPDRP